MGLQPAEFGEGEREGACSGEEEWEIGMESMGVAEERRGETGHESMRKREEERSTWQEAV